VQELLKSIPWSGVAFIITSVLLFSYWIKHPEIPFLIIIILEATLFFICFFVCDQESQKK